MDFLLVYFLPYYDIVFERNGLVDLMYIFLTVIILIGPNIFLGPGIFSLDRNHFYVIPFIILVLILENISVSL